MVYPVHKACKKTKTFINNYRTENTHACITETYLPLFHVFTIICSSLIKKINFNDKGNIFNIKDAMFTCCATNK